MRLLNRDALARTLLFLAIVGILYRNGSLALGGDSDGFQRFGSVLVFLGSINLAILASALGENSKYVSNLRKEVAQLRGELMSERTVSLTLMGNLERYYQTGEWNFASTKLQIERSDSQKKYFDEQMRASDGLIERADQTNRLQSAWSSFGLIGLGTLQWGYGDLFVSRLAGILNG